MSNIVAIVGRPNVGKSTLFNRLTRTKEAIVDETSGVTRDRHYGKVEWGGMRFTIIDTGGYVSSTEDIFEKEIKKQVHLAMDEASAIIFMVDVTTGIHQYDEVIAGMLRKNPKKVFLVVNKVDNSKRDSEAAEFYGLGLGDFFSIASTSGSGTGELLDSLVESLDKTPVDDYPGIPRIAIIGRPNVGKSSMINLLLEEERCIVTPVPGTTRASVDTHFNKFGLEFILIDTAGLRRKGKVYDDIEYFSNVRSVRAIENSDVCVLLIDAAEGLTGQDMSIFRLIENHQKGVVVAVNKWDLINKAETNTREFDRKIKSMLAPFSDVPVVYTSVIKKQRVLNVLELAGNVFERGNLQLDEEKLNEVMLPIIENFPPPSVKGKLVKIFSITQDIKNPRVFIFYCNLDQYFKESYERFLENKLRENFNLTGIPLRIVFKRGGRRERQRDKETK